MVMDGSLNQVSFAKCCHRRVAGPLFQAVVGCMDQRVDLNGLPKDAREVLHVQIACVGPGNDDDRDPCRVRMGSQFAMHVATT